MYNGEIRAGVILVRMILHKDHALTWMKSEKIYIQSEVFCILDVHFAYLVNSVDLARCLNRQMMHI